MVAATRALSLSGVRAALVAGTAAASIGLAWRSSAAIDDDMPGLVQTALGLEEQRTFLLQHDGLYPLHEQANSLPAGARILLTYNCSGFHIDRATFCIEVPLIETIWPKK